MTARLPAGLFRFPVLARRNELQSLSACTDDPDIGLDCEQLNENVEQIKLEIKQTLTVFFIEGFIRAALVSIRLYQVFAFGRPASRRASTAWHSVSEEIMVRRVAPSRLWGFHCSPLACLCLSYVPRLSFLETMSRAGKTPGTEHW